MTLYFLFFIENERHFTTNKQTVLLWYLKTQYGFNWPIEKDSKEEEQEGREYERNLLRYFIVFQLETKASKEKTLQ